MGRWYRNGENHRLVQPVGKQYAYGTGPENLSNEQQLRNENNYLKIHIEVLKSTKNWKGRGARNNGEIIAYTIGDKQDTAFVLDTLDQLPQTTDCLLHSDQGSVYTSFDYQNQIKQKALPLVCPAKGHLQIMPASNRFMPH